MCAGFISENNRGIEETVPLMFGGLSAAGSARADDLTGSEASGFRLPLSHQRRRVAERVLEERRRLEHVHDDV